MPPRELGASYMWPLNPVHKGPPRLRSHMSEAPTDVTPEAADARRAEIEPLLSEPMTVGSTW